MSSPAEAARGSRPGPVVAAGREESDYERLWDGTLAAGRGSCLIRSLELEGATLTIDAMGCQREIAACAREAGAHYLLQVKGNQPTLLEQVREVAADLARRRRPGEVRPVFDRFREVDKGHGRIETRVCIVSHDLERIERRADWMDLAGVVVMLREREDVISGKQTREMSYFILSDSSASARTVAGQIRAHWAIENTLHWSLDMVWGEDAHQVRHRQAAENFSRLRRFSAGLIKQSVGARMSGKRLRNKCMRNPATILAVLAGEEVSRPAMRRPNRKQVGRFGQGGSKSGV